MFKYLKVPFIEPQKNVFLQQLRERVLRTMLLSSFLAGTVLFALALIPALQKRTYITILAYSFIYIWTILIAFAHRLPYRLRAITWLLIFYIFGTINLVDSGLNVDAGLFLLTFIAMAILFMDLQGGLSALILSVVTVLIMGFINVTGNYQLPIGLPQSHPLLWVIGGIVFLTLGALLIYALTVMVHGLDRNLRKVERLAEELEQTNQTLQLSEARYRTLVETSPSLVVLLDLQGNVLMVNQTGLDFLGYQDMEDVIGSHMLAFIAPQDQTRLMEAFQRTLQGGSPKDLTCLGMKKDGTQFFAELNATMVMDEAGKPQAVVVSGKDITARKQAEQALQDTKDSLAKTVVETKNQLKKASSRLEELVKHGPAVIFSFRASDRVVTYISENVTALVGHEARDFQENPDFWENHLHPEDRDRVLSSLDSVSNQGRAKYEYRFLKKDGAYCWLHEEFLILRDAQGNPQEYMGSWSDVTEVKKKEEALRFFQDRYRSLYESMMDAYASTDMEGRVQQFNLAFMQMLGYAAEELRELTYSDLTPGKWHDLEATIIKTQVLPRGYSEIYEKEYIRKDGTVIPVELRTVLMRNQAGKPSGMWAIVRDISGRKAIEQDLRESEERYRNLLDSSMQGIVVFQDLRITFINKAVTELLGYTRAELEPLALADIGRLMHPDDQSAFQQKLEQWLAGSLLEGRYSTRVIHKNGETHWLETRTMTVQIQGKPAVITTFIDVTEIRQAQAKLEENARELETIFNASEALVFLVDTDGKLIAANDKFATRFGLKPSAVAGIDLRTLLPEEVVMSRNVPFEQSIRSGEPINFIDEREGTWFENNLYPIKDSSGKVVSVAVYARNITEQRQVAEALRASEEQYRTLAETSHDMIFIIDQDDQIKYVNSFGAKILGQEPKKLVGQPRGRFFSPVTSQHQRDNILRVFKTGEAISSENANEFPSGSVWLHTWLVPLKEASGEVASVLGISRDITDRKRAEEVLQQARDQLEVRVKERTRELSDSQEQLRQLTAQTVRAQEEERREISRELHDEAGQALVTLKFDLAAIQDELPESEARSRERLSDSMDKIDETMLHIRDISHRLRPPVLEIGGIHLSLLDYCREISERTRIPISYVGEEMPGLSDEIGISLFRFVQEALTNIMKHSQASQVKVRLQYKKGHIHLSVEDNGRGMDASTRTDGQGLLGIKERLKILGGDLEIRSRNGRGVKLVGVVPWKPPPVV